MNVVGLTSKWVAAVRAAETLKENGLCKDTLAASLAGEEGFALKARIDAIQDIPSPLLPIRTRYFDQGLPKVIEKNQIRQLVLLGAGMDTRSFRLEWPKDLKVFEIDQVEVLREKETKLRHLGVIARCERKALLVDLRDDWPEVLLEAGFNPKERSAWVLEGLLYYLRRVEVELLLSRTSALAAPGSWLGADLANGALLTSPYTAPLLQAFTAVGAPWHFGCDDPAGFMAGYGWRTEVLDVAEFAIRHGISPFPLQPTTNPSSPRVYIIEATRLGSRGDETSRI